MTAETELEQSFASRRAIFLAGAGVSQSISPDARNWPKLLNSGATYLSKIGESGAASMVDRMVLDSVGDATILTAAAGIIRNKLGDHFPNWLADEFGGVQVGDPSIGTAVGAYGRTILTTNYDLLLERTTGLPGCNWNETEKVQKALSGEQPAVVHLHGTWNDPRSVIFTPEDYTRVTGAESAQVLQKAFSLHDRIVLLGCGDGLADQNLGNLLSWMRDVFGVRDATPFNLVRGEVDHRMDLQCRGVSYGDDYADLIPFLLSLTSLGDSTSVREREVMAASVRLAKSNMLRPLKDMTLRADLNTVEQDALELILPPILLPVPNEDFVISRRDSSAKAYERCDPHDETRGHNRILVVGDESSGMTTALRWMVATRQADADDGFPIYIDYRSLRSGVGALNDAVARELEAAGLAVSKKRSERKFPKVLLAIDNVSDGNPTKLQRLIEDLEGLKPEFVVVGSRDGEHLEVNRELRVAMPGLRVLFIGRLNTGDISQLALLIAPSAGRETAVMAIRILREQGLPRNFFTVALLISALISGDQLTNTSSQTRLLNEYLQQLLGRGESRDDSRFGLASEDLIDLLIALARGFVQSGSGSLPASRVSEIIEATFDAFDWSESASEAVTELVRRRVLRYQGKNVAFAQASYLHLFAARAAVDDSKFRDEIFGQPLRYSPIVTHYVSLARGDSAALVMVESLLGLEAATESVPRLGQDHEDPVLDSDSMEEFIVALERDGATTPEPIESPAGTELEGVREQGERGDALEALRDPDLEPFPIANPDDLSPVRKALLTLNLASNVLRDSEKVTDLTHKQAVLERLLLVWAHFVAVLEKDESFISFASDIYEQVASEFADGEEQEFEDNRQNWNDLLASITAFSGMKATLASRKLEKSLMRLLAEDEFMADSRKAIMAALLVLSIEDMAWGKVFCDVQRAHPRKWGVSFPMLAVAQGMYLQGHVAESQVKPVEDFVVRQLSTRLGLRGRDAKRADAGLRARLQKEKLRETRMRSINIKATPPHELGELD